MTASFFDISSYLTANPFLILLVISHVLADFHWQSQAIADGKSEDWHYLALHLAIVGLPLTLLALLFPRYLVMLALVFLSHCLIDLAKFFFLSQMDGHQGQVFLVDQILHLLALGMIYQLFPSPTLPWLLELAPSLALILFVLIISKPANIAFKLLFSRYQVKNNLDDETVLGAGATIGLLERLIMGIFLIFGQFAAIGLVFTAKSIARYNRISEDQAFAEYYLIGSLFSIMIVLLAYWLCLA